MFKGFNEFLGYSKLERRGIYALLLLILLMLVGLYYDEYFYEIPRANQVEFKQLLAERRQLEQIKDSLVQSRLQTFDPNAASSDYLQSIGLNARAAKSLVNYTSKGGYFKKPDDVLKIYNMDSAWYFRVKEYIVIQEAHDNDYSSEPEEKYRFEAFDPNKISQEKLEAMGLRSWQAKNIIGYREKYKPFEHDSEITRVYGIDSTLANRLRPFVKIDSTTFGRKAKPKAKPVVVDLNSADSLLLLKVKGIGSFTAGQILKERAALGGFHASWQLIGIYPIDSARFEKLKPQLRCEGPVKQLNINTASFKELLNHPYLEYRVVKNIVHFRENIRPFNKVSELRNIELVDDRLFRKIAPYLSVEDSVLEDE